jgi:putative ABC transport system permease protein
MDNLLNDLRYAARVLAKNPGFTLIAVITLALGIGANTTIFSVVNGVLLSPLPYQEPERLVQVWETWPPGETYSGGVSPNNFADWRNQAQSFDELGAYWLWLYTLTGTSEPTEVAGMKVSANFFALLGITPQMGRTFLPEEEQPDKNRVAIISHAFWQRRFDSNAEVIGQTLRLDDGSYTIIGVLPPDFRQTELAVDYGAEVWTPEAVNPADNRRANHYLSVIGRLKSGVTFEQVQTEMATIARQLEQAYPNTNKDRGVRLVSLHEQVTGGIRWALVVLQCATALVLLIACVNVANLLLARVTLRASELAIRSALGARRVQIVRLLLAESAVLAVLGGGVGLLLAHWGIDLLVGVAPRDIPRLDEIGLDGRVLGFTLGLSVLTVLLFGLAPAWQSAQVNLNQALKEGGRSAARGQGLRGLLVVAEIALTLVLLVGSGLLVRSLLRMQQVDLGFNPGGLLTLRVSLLESKYPERRQIADYYQQLLARTEQLPGATSAAITSSPPMIRLGGFRSSFEIEGQPVEPGRAPTVWYGVISPDYFRTLGVALLKGRVFDERDTYDAPPVAIISQNFARRYFPDREPLGKKIIVGRTTREIVGVVGNVKHSSPAEDEAERMYAPHSQNPRGTLALLIRTAGDPNTLITAAQKAVWEGDPEAAVSTVSTMEQVLAGVISRPRFNALLLAVFAVVAVVLSAVGIYGVISYTVTQHTREIGIRMALGAQAGDVLKLVVGQGMVLTLIGIAAGVAGALLLTRLMKGLLFSVTATDPLTFAGVSVLLSVIALLACYLPARRATKVDPIVALRYE